MMIEHKILKSGSAGNAVVLDSKILIDCGVAYKALQPYVPALRLALLTHAHQDHFNPATVRRLAEERPTLRWACGKWMVRNLIRAGVRKTSIDICPFRAMNRYPDADVIIQPEPLTHDVPNCGWHVWTRNDRAFYATDTATLEGISAPNYDLYLIEANHGEDEIRERIAQERADGAFPVAQRAQRTHLSEEKALDFIYSNIGRDGHFVLLHQHVEKEKSNA